MLVRSALQLHNGCALPLDCLLYSPQLARETVITLPAEQPTPVPLALATDGVMVRVRPTAHPEYRWSAPLTISPLGDRRVGAPARLCCKVRVR